MQPPQRLAQRRDNTQAGGTFTFWYRRPRAAKQVGAWMLNSGAKEAAFLTTAGDAPAVGERLELTGPDRTGRTTAGRSRESEPHLPRFGRVVRLDTPQGITRRVAIRFESPTSSSQIKKSEP